MPVINILGPENRGVDSSGEPLKLGPQQIYSAVNCALRNGVVGSRPGFHYQPLGITGCFQGAAGYAPAFGISAESFAARSLSLVTCVGGVLRRNAVDPGGAVACNPEVIKAQDFGRGPVYLFQAENWLIAQSPGRNTHWWGGTGDATASPGMEPESLWTDPDVQVTRICPEKPEANIPDCDQFDCDPNACTLVIVEKRVLTGTTGFFRVTNSGFAEAHITAMASTPPGAVFTPPVLDIPAGTTRRVDVNVSGVVNLSTTGVTVSVDSSCGVGTLDFFIPPATPPPTCSTVVSDILALSNTTAQVSIQNNGSNPIENIFLTAADASSWLVTPSSMPLAPGAIGVFGIDGLGASLGGRQFVVSSNCAPTTGGTIPVHPDDPPDVCAFEVFVWPGDFSGDFKVTNLSTIPIEVSGIGASGDIVISHPLPETMMGPGDYLYVHYVSPSGTAMGQTITLVNSCEDDYEFDV